MHAENDHFQYGKLQSLTVVNGYLNILYMVKGVRQPSFICWQALQEAVRPWILQNAWGTLLPKWSTRIAY